MTIALSVLVVLLVWRIVYLDRSLKRLGKVLCESDKHTFGRWEGETMQVRHCRVCNQSEARYPQARRYL